MEELWIGFWHTGWQKAGWLEGWLVVVGTGWEAGCGGWVAKGTLEPRDPGQGVVNDLFGGPEPTHLSRRNPLSTVD